MNSEMYSLDINRKGNMIAYGGKEDKFTVSAFPSMQTITEVPDFQDSVIYIKFILEEVLLCATFDGILSLYMIEGGSINEITNRDIEEDITFIEYNEGWVLVGTEKGSVHIFNENLEEEIFFVGHNAEIKQLKVRDKCLYTLSSNKYIIYDIETQNLISKKILPDFITFELLENNMSLISCIDQTILLKDNEIVLQRYNFGAEAILKIGDDLICGGSGFSLNIINFKNTTNSYNFKFMTENIEGISKIVNLGGNIIGFSTFCGKIAIGDYRDGRSFAFYDGNVGIIYDLKFYKKFCAVCGSDGVNLIHL